ncbi:glycoside hydrolase family 88 protein [Membranihabitans marinus]|uniref:glycoside hydrolase family 88 protein n=1 Tax=Membranihabitans marinus TaxID=1227546 RepID=UPI001F258A19|nr:glycoside hydrolase family 88 protein [Membranihabitans marinus]
MKRRDFILKTAMTATAFSPILNSAFITMKLHGSNIEGKENSRENGDGYQYIFPTVENRRDRPIPAGKRLPFNWEAITIPAKSSKKSPILKWSSNIETHKTCSLRFSVAIDVREEKQIDVVLAESGKTIASFDVRFAPVNQVQSVLIESQYLPDLFSQGVQLRMTKGEKPLWILSPDSQINGDARGLLPHLMIPGEMNDAKQSFYDRLFSLDSIQQFGWMEGCVLDALWDLREIEKYKERADKALQVHLNHFLPDENLLYENPRSESSDNKIYGVECTLPFSVITRERSGHPSVKLTQAYWTEKYSRVVNDPSNDNYTAEGSYTVAFPMMVIGMSQNDSFLIDLSLEQLRLRKQFLKYNGAVYLRYFGDGRRTFRNWARGIAWYMLGLVRTLILLEPHQRPNDLVEELAEISEWAMSYQMSTGLWRCFVDEREVRYDTSGSAGIAAALALGAKYGMLPSEARLSAQATLNALLDHLTDDGFLTGVAQSNRDGERLQRDDYRVIFQMGMGLMGQLMAALERTD